MLKIEVDDSLGETLLDLRRAQQGTQDAMRAEASRAITASWVPALAAAASGAQQQKLLVSGAGADVGDLSFDLNAGRGPTLSGGLDASHWYAVDYGMQPKRITAPNRQKTLRVVNGRPVRAPAQVWVGRNLPSRAPAGRVVFPTIAAHSPEFVAAWVQGMLGQFDGTPLDVDSSDELSQVAGSWR